MRAYYSSLPSNSKNITLLTTFLTLITEEVGIDLSDSEGAFANDLTRPPVR